MGKVARGFGWGMVRLPGTEMIPFNLCSHRGPLPDDARPNELHFQCNPGIDAAYKTPKLPLHVSHFPGGWFSAGRSQSPPPSQLQLCPVVLYSVALFAVCLGAPRLDPRSSPCPQKRPMYSVSRRPQGTAQSASVADPSRLHKTSQLASNSPFPTALDLAWARGRLLTGCTRRARPRLCPGRRQVGCPTP